MIPGDSGLAAFKIEPFTALRKGSSPSQKCRVKIALKKKFKISINKGINYINISRRATIEITHSYKFLKMLKFLCYKVQLIIQNIVNMINYNHLLTHVMHLVLSCWRWPIIISQFHFNSFVFAWHRVLFIVFMIPWYSCKKWSLVEEYLSNQPFEFHFDEKRVDTGSKVHIGSRHKVMSSFWA